MLWIIKRLKQSKSVFWRDSSISKLLRALLDIRRMKQRFVVLLFFFIPLSAHISFPFWLIIVTDRSDFTLHQPKKVFCFKKGFFLTKKIDPICKGLHLICCFLRLMIKFWNHNNTNNWTHWYFPSNQLGAKLVHILQNVICTGKTSRSQQQLCTCESKLV